MDMTNASEVVFDDGILWIIQEWDKPERVQCTNIVLSAEYDKPISLADIERDYPCVRKVLFDDALKGFVYDYGNHKEGEWELVGTTKGYA